MTKRWSWQLGFGSKLTVKFAYYVLQWPFVLDLSNI